MPDLTLYRYILYFVLATKQKEKNIGKCIHINPDYITLSYNFRPTHIKKKPLKTILNICELQTNKHDNRNKDMWFTSDNNTEYFLDLIPITSKNKMKKMRENLFKRITIKELCDAYPHMDRVLFRKSLYSIKNDNFFNLSYNG